MLEIIKSSALSVDFLNTGQGGIPLLVCTDSNRVLKMINSAGYKEKRINQELSKQLLDFPKEDRPKLVEQTLNSIYNCHSPTFVTDFEMLFDPR